VNNKLVFKKPLLLLGLVFLMTLSGCNGDDDIVISSIPTGDESSDTDGPIDEDETMMVEYDWLNIHFRHESENPFDWALWLWEQGKEGKLYLFETASPDYGAKLRLPADTFETRTRINFIIRKAGTWAGQSRDNYFMLKHFEDYMVNGEIHVYLLHGETDIFTRIEDAMGDRVTKAYFTDWNKIKFETTANYHSYELLANGVPIITGGQGQTDKVLTLDSDADLSVLYRIKVLFEATDDRHKFRTVSSSNLFNTTKFLNEYTYDGELGALYTPQSTTFKVWAPTSSRVTLRLYRSGTPTSISGELLTNNFIPHTMVRGDKGVWSATVSGDLHRRYYTYIVENSEGINEVVDPYAVSAGVNGMRGQILDFSRLNPEGWDNITFDDINSPTDLTVYELHVRDLTNDPSWNGSEENRGKFLGLIEEGTTYTEGAVTVSTGFDHMKELGFNALQILPFYDQANNELDDNPNPFNWGYNPLNYNVLEGQYSSDPFNGEVRVSEFKQVVKTLADNGIRIIMDVVYNHMHSAAGSYFNMLVPDYYFRIDEATGNYHDGAGVGNETDSFRPMFRKFMKESVEFWSEEYNIMGYRYDLMGLHDYPTMQEVRNALNDINPDIVVYGEPWKSFSYSPIQDTGLMTNHYNLYNNLTGVGGFNDAGRDAIKGGNWQDNLYGWIQKGESYNISDAELINRTKGMMAGMNGNYYSTNNRDPKKTINYASCHDNLTLFDQLSATVGASDVANASVAVNAIITFSLGVPFIYGGEEIMRSKRFDDYDPTDEAMLDRYEETVWYFDNITSPGWISHNSYHSPDEVNNFKWGNKVTYHEHFLRYKEMIRLRADNPLLRRSTPVSRPDANMGFWDGPLAFSTIAAWHTSPDKVLYVFGNARESVATGDFRSTIGWDTTSDDSVRVLFDSTGFYSAGTILTTQVTMRPYQVLLVERP
jgi:pullulanase